MGEVVATGIGIIFIYVIGIYVISTLLNEKVNFKDKISFLGYIGTLLALILGYTISIPLFRMFVNTLILILGCKAIFRNRKLSDVFSAVIINQLLFLISEIGFLLIMSIINNFDVERLIENTFGTLITNTIVPILVLLMVKKFNVKNIYLKLSMILDNINSRKLVTIIICSVFVINLLLGSMYYQINIFILMLINGLFVTFVIFEVYETLEERRKVLEERKKALEAENKNIQYQAENDALLNTLNEYERIADQQRVINHENTNQLNALEQMIENKEGEEAILGYIHKLKHDSKTADETIMEKTKRIPSGGLQGIIYQKMIKMKKRKVTYSLNISRDLKELDFKKLGIETNVDMCKVIGVFLDNAIEEVKGLRERIVDIELYKDEKDFCIGITNSFGKNKNLDHIDELGYTTKGEGHGYGLSLVKQILESNKRLENERRITGRYFTQVLRIKNMK